MSADRVAAIANEAGRARQNIENTFNVEKNGGFGLEPAFCANETAAQNYHLLMQVAYTLWQLLAGGLFRRLMRSCRKMTQRSMAELLHVSTPSRLLRASQPQVPRELGPLASGGGACIMAERGLLACFLETCGGDR